MNLDELDKLTSPEEKAKAKKFADNKKQAEVDLAKAYNRCFGTNEGQKVLADLTQRMIYNNDTAFSSQNVNYEAAYKNGEAGVVKFIINQIAKAQVI